MRKKDYIVSAIVSVYNCERFIAGCLDDLEQQTIADKLEIVVVNSGSQQNEEAIIKKFQEKYDNIVYIRTENRETLYQAWNRGIKAASGKYITNANSDDRHRKDALEIMSDELEGNANIGLVYYDFIVTETENETFENCTPVGYQKWPEFDRFLLLSNPFCGHQPMWRRSLHKRFGYFDETLRVAGDYDFWLRIAEKGEFKHINACLGLYLSNPDSVEHKNYASAILEVESVINKYIKRAAHHKKILAGVKKKQQEMTFELGYFYYKNKQPLLAVKTFFRSVLYSWRHFNRYKQVLIFFLPPGLTKVLVKGKKCFKKMGIQLCPK